MQYRYSALDAYRQCPTKYRKQYLENTRAPFTMIWLLNGTLFHEAMEKHYKTGDDRVQLGKEAWAGWLRQEGVETPWKVVSAFTDLWKVQRKLLEPFRRGTICRDDGTKYTKPTATTAFRKLKSKTEWDQLRREALQYQDIMYGVYLRPQDDIPSSFCECMDWLTDYEHPTEYGTSIESEKKFFITDPWGNTHEGCIDQVFEFEDGYAIHDFKTSKMEKVSVDLDPQLNMYAYAAKQLFGEWPKQISLHFVRNNTVVKSKADPERVEKVYNSFVHPIIKSIELSMEHNVWVKHSPEAFNAPCNLCEFFLAGMCNQEYKETAHEV